MHLIARMHLLCVLCFCYLLSIYYVWRQSSAGLSFKFGICIYKGVEDFKKHDSSDLCVNDIRTW